MKYSVECRLDGSITYSLELLGETFAYTAHPVKQAAGSTEAGAAKTIRENDAPCFEEQVRTAYPALGEDVFRLVSELDFAPDDITACNILAGIQASLDAAQEPHSPSKESEVDYYEILFRDEYGICILAKREPTIHEAAELLASDMDMFGYNISDITAINKLTAEEAYSSYHL